MAMDSVYDVRDIGRIPSTPGLFLQRVSAIAAALKSERRLRRLAAFVPRRSGIGSGGPLETQPQGRDNNVHHSDLIAPVTNT